MKTNILSNINVTDAVNVDGSTIKNVSGTLEVPTGGIGTSQIADGAIGTTELANSAVTTGKMASGAVTTPILADGSVTAAKKAAINYVISSSSGSFTTTSNSYVSVFSTPATITTSGRPVAVNIQCASGVGSDTAYFGANGSSSLTSMDIQIVNGLGGIIWAYNLSTFGNGYIQIPAAMSMIDASVVGFPGAYTYQMKVRLTPGTNQNALVHNVELLVYEL